MRRGEVVASVDTLQSRVIDTLHAVFQLYVMSLLHLVEIVEQGLVDAIGPGADDDAFDFGMV